jgi:murein DD-endopeptidase MepM/ murein hydrolase activator NlpD
MILPVTIDYGRYRKYGRNIGTIEYPLFHAGHDFDCPVGTPTVGIDRGKIAFIGNVNGFGGFNPDIPGGVVVVKHGNVFAIYGHIDYRDDLILGAEVDKGRVLGKVANYFYGKKDGTILELPHLHFCIYRGKNIFSTKWGYVNSLKDFYNPLNYIKDHNNGLIY